MPAYDGHIALHGVDTSTDPGIIPKGIHAIDAVNRAFRGGMSRTRDPFFSMELDFDSPESEETFINGNVSGVFAYKKINNFIQPHLMVAVGNKLLAGRVYSNKVSFKCIYDGIAPQWQHSFFVQAEEILVWQNGKQTPQVWDGLSITTQTAAIAVASVGKSNPMPIGNVMTYAHGRIFLATEDNIVLASDHIYSQGFGKNKTVVNFQESTYPSSGDGFGTYSRIGRITGMGVVPRHPAPNGHGEVVIFGESGAWAIDPTPDRALWADLAIQQVILIGRGCASPHSVVAVNNDMFYRCFDRTISSLKHNLTEREQAWTDRSISREVQRYLNFDLLEQLQFSHSIFADNRLIVSCGTRMESSNGYGKHRFSLGMVSLDLDRGNTTNQIDTGFSWDGLWTGPRVTGMAKLAVDKGEKYLFASYDSDGRNRIYYLNYGSERNDYQDKVEKRIKSFYIIGDLFNPVSADSAPVVNSLKGTAAFLSNINDLACISMDYRPDRHPLWNPIMKENCVGCDTECAEFGSHLNESNDSDEECDFDNPGDTIRETPYPFRSVKPYGDILGSETPKKNQFRDAVSHAVSKGYSFQLKINILGVLTVNRVVAVAEQSADINLTNSVAFRNKVEYCNREHGCNEQEDYFDYIL